MVQALFEIAGLIGVTLLFIRTFRSSYEVTRNGERMLLAILAAWIIA